MTAPLIRIDGERPGFGRKAKPDRRRESRVAAGFKGILHTSQGREVHILVADVSVHGCSIRAHAPWLRIGSVVRISLSSGAGQAAIVRWLRGDAAGMEFLRPIPPDDGEWRDLLDAGI